MGHPPDFLFYILVLLWKKNKKLATGKGESKKENK